MQKIVVLLLTGIVSFTSTHHITYIQSDGTNIIPEHSEEIVLSPRIAESELTNPSAYVRRPFYDAEIPEGTLETLEDQLRYYIELRNYILYIEQRKGVDISNYQSSGGDRFGLGALISSLVNAVDRIRNEMTGGAGDFRKAVKN